MTATAGRVEGMDMRRRTATISARLYGLVLACVLSGALSAVALITYDFQRSRDRLVADVQARTLALAIDMETELRRLQSGLEVLATSPSIQNGNLRALHEQGTRVMGLLQLDNIVVRERSGRYVVNMNVPFGQPLPSSINSGLFQSVFNTGLPLVTDLYSSARTGGHLISIAVPVARRLVRQHRDDHRPHPRDGPLCRHQSRFPLAGSDAPASRGRSARPHT